MKKDFLFLKKSRWLLFMLFALLGVSPAWADTLTEGFEDVFAVDADGNAVTGWNYGYGLSNGWKVIGGGQV